MKTRPCSLDKARRMKSTMRQTVAPPVPKTVGESRSPHLSYVPAAGPEQSLGSCPPRAAKPHGKGGRGRPFSPEVLVMDGNCFVGIDVSKHSLDGRVWRGQALRYDNSAAGIAQLVALLRPLSVTLVVVEATGGLEVPLVRALQQAGIPIAVINPRQARDFAKASGTLAKTDRTCWLISRRRSVQHHVHRWMNRRWNWTRWWHAAVS